MHQEEKTKPAWPIPGMIDPEKFIKENSEKKNSSNLQKTTEENLRKELESILLQVYIEHINKSKDFDIKVFEKHVSRILEIFSYAFLYIKFYINFLNNFLNNF
jgi:hypothetical protein